MPTNKYPRVREQYLPKAMQDLLILAVMLLLLVAMAVRRHAPSKALYAPHRQHQVGFGTPAPAANHRYHGPRGSAPPSRPWLRRRRLLQPPGKHGADRRHLAPSPAQPNHGSTAPYGPFWCVTRRNLTSGVLSPPRLHRFAPARRDALCGLVADLREQCTSNPDGLALAAESIRSAIFGLFATMCFGEGLDKAVVRAMADAQHEFISFFPQLRVFARRPALARLIHRKRWSKLLAYRRKQEDMYLPLIHARRTRHRQSGELPAYVDTLNDLWVPDDHKDASKQRRQRRLADGEIVGLCAEFVGAGTETVASELQYIMANLVKRPHMQEAVRREIDAAVDPDAEEVGEEVLGKLEYLNTVVMEVLRLHPTVTLVRQVLEEDDVVHDGRRIPAGTEMFFLPESIARDKTAWADPDEFRPERFLTSRGGEMVSLVAAAGSGGREVRMVPFGAGRRVCPGMGVAMLHMGYFMANLIKEFEWRDITFMKRPLRARLVQLPSKGGVY